MPNPREADVVVVGAGAGGAAAAWALASRGVRVLLLESGPAFDPFTDYRLHLADWEQQTFPHKAGSTFDYTLAPLQAVAADAPRTWNHRLGRAVSDGRRHAGRYEHVRGVGGSTLRFTGEAHRLHPAAMKMRSRFGVAADWPLGYRDLEPYYLQAERALGVAGPAANGARWRSAPYPLPPHAHSHASAHLGRAFRTLGWGWQANPVAALSAPYDGRPSCNYCGQCQRGCPRRDKGSADVTFVARALASGRCELRTQAHVLRIEAGPRDRVQRVSWIEPGGAPHTASPRAVVLAAGAVFTPRLLLLSTGAATPQGLANESGQVGRHWMETLAWIGSALHPQALGSHRGLPADGICWDFNAPDAITGTVGGCRLGGGMAEADLAGPVNYARRVVGGWGAAHRRGMREAFGHVLTVAAVGEFLPNAGSYVDLDPTRRDEHGDALARLHSRLEAGEFARLRFMAERGRAVLDVAGCAPPFEESSSADVFGATHVFGGCRMGDDPRDSVVDRHGASHRWRNLYIADGSVFPSSGGGEAPSLTIQALALRSAAHLRARLVAREL